MRLIELLLRCVTTLTTAIATKECSSNNNFPSFEYVIDWGVFGLWPSNWGFLRERREKEILGRREGCYVDAASASGHSFACTHV